MPYRRTPAVLERLETKRLRILETATRIAAQSGLDQLTTKAVADHARIAVGTIYNHFPNHTELVAGVIAQRIAADIAAMRERWSADPLATLAGAIAVYVHRMRATRVLGHSLTAAPAYRVAVTRELERLILGLGKNAPVHAGMAATAVYGALNAVLLAGNAGAPGKKSEPALICMALRVAGVANEAAQALAGEVGGVIVAA